MKKKNGLKFIMCGILLIITSTSNANIEVREDYIITGNQIKDIHSADQDGDYTINLSELLRVIQFFNSYGYHCRIGSEDGYNPIPLINKKCFYHDSDYNPQNWKISLTELLRLVQFFNSDGYHSLPGSEDGFYPGLKGTVIIIDSIEELQMIGKYSTHPLNGNYVITHNIDASITETWNNGDGFRPIGHNIAPFNGTFDGMGYIIEGLFINRPEEDNVGLFRCIGINGTVKNLGLETSAITGDKYVGILTGRHRGRLLNSHATGSVTANECVGILLGYSQDGQTWACYSMGTVTGTFNVGGLAGQGTGTFEDCYVKLEKLEALAYVGGFIAINSAKIKNCYATGPISGDFGGGLVGIGTENVVFESFWDRETTGFKYSSGSDNSFGKTTVEMMAQITFWKWDFTIWCMKDGEEYPYIRKFILP